jgi:ketosteroid isomerase-like protein
MNDALSICHNQVMAFFRHLDDNDYAGLVKKLTPDAQWHRQGAVLAGHDAVLAALSKRSPTVRIHHLITNLVADSFDDAHYTMRAYMLVVRHDDGKPLAGPAPLAGIENIRTTHIKLKHANGQWLIAHLSNDELSFAVAQ